MRRFKSSKISRLRAEDGDGVSEWWSRVGDGKRKAVGRGRKRKRSLEVEEAQPQNLTRSALTNRSLASQPTAGMWGR
jgi:hypothetical protein